jgi:L-fuculose-phosphate aldolase
MTATTDPRPNLVEIAELMYSRRLTNSAGGNVSCRIGDQIFVTPRYLGSKNRWRLREEMVLVFEGDFARGEFNCIEGDPAKVSRESRMHFGCYQHFPEINGIIHAHPLNLNVFASAGRAVVPTNQYTEKFGKTPVVPDLPSHSQELADAVVEMITPRKDVLAKNGLGLILSYHGVLCVGRDLADAYDTLDRLEWSAYALLMRPNLPA